MNQVGCPCCGREVAAEWEFDIRPMRMYRAWRPDGDRTGSTLPLCGSCAEWLGGLAAAARIPDGSHRVLGGPSSGSRKLVFEDQCQVCCEMPTGRAAKLTWVSPSKETRRNLRLYRMRSLADGPRQRRTNRARDRKSGYRRPLRQLATPEPSRAESLSRHRRQHHARPDRRNLPGDGHGTCHRTRRPADYPGNRNWPCRPQDSRTQGTRPHHRCPRRAFALGVTSSRRSKPGLAAGQRFPPRLSNSRLRSRTRPAATSIHGTQRPVSPGSMSGNWTGRWCSAPHWKAPSCSNSVGCSSVSRVATMRWAGTMAAILVVPRAPSDHVLGVAERLSVLVDGRCTFSVLRPRDVSPPVRFEAAG